MLGFVGSSAKGIQPRTTILFARVRQPGLHSLMVNGGGGGGGERKSMLLTDGDAPGCEVAGASCLHLSETVV